MDHHAPPAGADGSGSSASSSSTSPFPLSLTREDTAWIGRRAVTALGALGSTATLAADGASVRRDDGATHGLDSVFRRCASTPRDQWGPAIDLHFGQLVRARSDVPPSRLAPEEFESRVRTRLLTFDAVDSAPIDLGYARRLADDLAMVLCIDNPETVAYLPSDEVSERGVDRLFVVGQRNTDAEPVEFVSSPTDGPLTWVAGASVFIASKLGNMPAILHAVFGVSEAPDGVVVGVPDRNTICMHRVRDETAVLAISDLATATAKRHETAVGKLSPHIYYWREGVVTRISTADPDTRQLSITPGPDLEAALQRFL
ncbi:hypothetical protein [Gordonia sp. NPDC127522]|uniref:hypothetical protein n=1 Tax=Gordonia sp. NPDC127522 TaxID=3345390 RepID=UPI0036440258